MANHRNEQAREVGHEDGKDKQPANAPAAGVGCLAPDSAAPILQSEDDELSDEDAPK
jgi:hypothetical protein